MASVTAKPFRPEYDPGMEEIRLLQVLQHGLPLVSRPYAAVAAQTGLSEARVMELINGLIVNQRIKRYGVVVRHHEAGYRANAMIVWDVPELQLSSVARRMREYPFVTLCYRRPRQLPDWPYNLFCMIHGRERESVLNNLEQMITACGWADIPRAILFSKRRFKQRGARYFAPDRSTGAPRD
jgi:DNA-binding Lrp family transcriptional regulator